MKATPTTLTTFNTNEGKEINENKGGKTMTTLIIAKKEDGTIIGRCDDKCYNAQHPKCRCVCGGTNHGVGFHQAVRNLEIVKPPHLIKGEKVLTEIQHVQYQLFEGAKP